MRAVAQARPELAAHQRALRLVPKDAVRELVGILGGKLTAYVANVGETRAVRMWAEGDRDPQPDKLLRIREALVIALTLCDHDEATVVQAWFQGLNPQLDDRAPAT